jgi:hypothetical protein
MTVSPGISAGRAWVVTLLMQVSEKRFNAPEAHIMYLTVYSSFLISFVLGGIGPSRVIKFLMHLSGPSRVIKFLYSPAPPPPTVWALDLPTIHPVKVTRGLVCIKQPVHNVLDACISITWGSGRGLDPGILKFFGL